MLTVEAQNGPANSKPFCSEAAAVAVYVLTSNVAVSSPQ